MNLRATVVMLMGAAGLVSCNGSTPPPSSDNRAAAMGDAPQRTAPVASTGSSAGASQQAKPVAARAGQSPASQMAEDVPPAGAQFTLFCEVFHGPGHVQQAIIKMNELVKATNKHGWHLLHAEDDSTLYYGYYRTIDDVAHDPQEVQRAQADRRMIETLRDPLGDRLFRDSVFVGVNAPDPQAPPEWNIANAPANAFWSVQIAAYQGSPERKQYAVDAVRKLRSLGKPAYYYHGPTVSSVCIGTWPRSAVRAQGDRDDAHTVDPNQPIVVFNDRPPAELLERLKQSNEHPEVAAPKLEIEDASLQAVLAEFPHHAVNGVEHARSGNGEAIYDPSFLVQVPHTANGGYAASNDAGPGGAGQNPADSATSAILDQQPPAPQPAAPSNLGRLRSIGDR